MKAFSMVAATLVVLVGVAWALFAPDKFSYTTNQQRPGGFSQQTVGESTAGRAQDMSAGEAADQADSGETGRRAQRITATGNSDTPLASEQAARVIQYFKSNAGKRSDDKFSISIGASVPRQISLDPLPPELTDVMGKFRGDEYVLVDDRMIVVEPKARRIVAIIPLA